MVTRLGQMQLGKNKLNNNFLEALKKHFEKNAIVKISVLKSARENKEKVKEYSEKIKEELGKKYTTKIIGFTIIVRKWRRETR